MEKQRNINDMVDAICSEIGESKRDKINKALQDHFKEWFFTLWHWDDIKQQATDDTFEKEFQDNILTDEQCQEIEDFILRKHDATIGINWDVIQCALDEVAPEL